MGVALFLVQCAAIPSFSSAPGNSQPDSATGPDSGTWSDGQTPFPPDGQTAQLDGGDASAHVYRIFMAGPYYGNFALGVGMLDGGLDGGVDPKKIATHADDLCAGSWYSAFQGDQRNWRALIWPMEGHSPFARLSGLQQPAGGWYRTKKNPTDPEVIVFGTLAQVTNGSPTHPVHDVLGGGVTGEAWTGGSQFGALSENCGLWQEGGDNKKGYVGLPADIQNWFSYKSSACNIEKYIYCIEFPP